MSRGDWGAGSVKQHRPGVWDVRLSAGVDVVTGKRVQIHRRVTGTKKEALAELARLRTEHASGTPSRDVTLGALIVAWREHANHAGATSDNYDRAVKRIPSKMLAARADSLGAHDLQRLFTELGKQGHGAHAVTQIRAVISGAYTQGVKWRWVSDNPVRNTEPPKIRKRRDTTPKPKQVTAMLTLARAREDLMFAVWFRLVIVTGARSAELAALRWSDIDLRARTLTIANSIAHTRARDLLPTKNDGSHRTIPLDVETAKELRRWKTLQAARSLEQGQPLVKDPFVLSLDIDAARPPRPDLATRRFKKIAKKAGLPNARLHDMRHAAGTIMLANGVDPKTVASRLGHTRVSTTLDLYGHVLDERAQAAADVLGELAN